MDGLDIKHGWRETHGLRGGKSEEATRMTLNRWMDNAHAVECNGSFDSKQEGQVLVNTVIYLRVANNARNFCSS